MLEGLHQKLSGEYYHGVEVVRFEADQLKFFKTSLKAEKGELNPEVFQNDKDFKDNKSKPCNICLVVNTDQVLSRKSDQIVGDIQQGIERLFPNLNMKDFYYQCINSEDSNYISIARKDHVDNIVKHLNQKGLYATKICLGNPLAKALSQLSDLETVTTSNAIIQLKERFVIEKQKDIASCNFDIQGIKVENTHLLSFLGAVQQKQTLFQSTDNFNDLQKASQDEYNQFLLFFYGLRTAIVILLIALMLNFYYFNSFYDFVNANQGNENSTLKANYDNLKNQVDQLDRLTNQILMSESSSTSYLLNDIIRILPSNIRLNELNFQPLSKRLKKGKPVELKNNEIIIKGETFNNEDFALWTNGLEQLEWASSVVISKFDSAEDDNTQRFELILKLKT